MEASNHLACEVGIDGTIGPWAGPACRGGFDFTLLFEEAVFALPVQCLFLLALPAQVLRLRKSCLKVVSSRQQQAKAVSSIALVAFNIVLLTLFAQESELASWTTLTVPCAAATLAASLGLSLLSWLHHQRATRPSDLLNYYLFFSILLDTARARTLWMMGPHRAVLVLFTASMALRTVMLVLESTEKRRILTEQHKDLPKEATSSTWNRAVFFWLTSLFVRGYRHTLSLHDLYQLDPKLRSEPLYSALAEAWDEVPDKERPNALFSTWLRVFIRPVLAAVFPRLCQSAFSYAQPFLVSAAIRLAVQPQSTDAENTGYGLVGAYLLVYVGVAVASGQYTWHSQRAACIMRGSLSALIFRKALHLDLLSSEVSPSAALTLVGTDVETVAQGIERFHEIWAGAIEIAVGVFLMSRELGAAAAMPIALTFVALIISGSIAMPMGKAQAAWIQASQNRVTAVSMTLGAIKWIKVSGLNDTAFAAIRGLRGLELAVSKRFRSLLGASLTILVGVGTWSPILTFAVFAVTAANGDTTLTITKAFTSYSLMIILAKPLSDIVLSAGILSGGLASAQRIQVYLNAKEYTDNRVRPSSTRAPFHPSKTEPSCEDIESEKSIAPGKVGPSSTLGADVAVDLQGSFTWPGASVPVFEIPSWTIHRRALTVLLGPVGCGKSTLLKAILGELSMFRGSISSRFRSAAYCDQNPWLPNASVRDIIVAQAVFDEKWYDVVLRACALRRDLGQWPAGDRTIVGTMGFTLSGGQKKRLSLARAVYSKQSFVMLDDVFSGLDTETREAVFQAVLGSGGLLRDANFTVLMASSDSRWVSHADQVLILDQNGRVEYSGSPSAVRQQGLGPVTPSTPQEHPRKREEPEEGPELIRGIDTKAEHARRLGDTRLYGFYATAAGLWNIVTFLTAMVAFAFFSIFPNIWLKWWAEANEERPNQDLGKWLGVYAALGVGSILAILFGTWQLIIVVVTKTGVIFHDLLLKTTSRAPLSFHATTDTGVTVNRFSQDLQLVDMELPGAAFGVAISVTTALASLIVIAVSSIYIGVTLPLLVPFFYLLLTFYLRTSRQMRLLDIEHKAPLYSNLISPLSGGLPTIRAFGWQHHLERLNLAALDNSQRPSYLLASLQCWLTFTVGALVAVIALILIVLVTRLRERIGPGYAGVALTNVLGFSGSLHAIITTWAMLELSLGALSRIRDFAAETTPEPGSDVGEAAAGQRRFAEDQGGEIELVNVSAVHSSSEKALDGISISVTAGQRIAICGRTGSGKSSLMLALLRLVPTTSGTILLSGVDISTMSTSELRSMHAVAVPQETFVFDDETVRFNVDPTYVARDDSVITRILERIGLWRKIESRGGLNAQISEAGLSQGELRLLGLARAMVRAEHPGKPRGRVLLLDEVTSSLDDDTSAMVDEIVRSWFCGWTVISVVHRLDSIATHFDAVAVMSNGRIVEYGRAEELLRSPHSHLSSLQATGDSASRAY